MYPLDDIFLWLEAFLHAKPPCSVDSQGVAGLLDLLRTSGMWFASVRYGYVFGALASAGNVVGQGVLPHLWRADKLAAVAALFEKAWVELLESNASLDVTQHGRYSEMDASRNKTTHVQIVSTRGDIEDGGKPTSSPLTLRAAMKTKMCSLISSIDLSLPPTVQQVRAPRCRAELLHAAFGPTSP